MAAEIAISYNGIVHEISCLNWEELPEVLQVPRAHKNPTIIIYQRFWDHKRQSYVTVEARNAEEFNAMKSLPSVGFKNEPHEVKVTYKSVSKTAKERFVVFLNF